MNRIDQIDSMELFIIKLPLVEAFETSLGAETYKEALLLKLKSEEIAGWGECVASPEPFYSSETNETALHIIRTFLLPVIMKIKNFSLDEVLRAFERIRGHNMAKATVENALLDLQAKMQGIPLYELIGGEKRDIMSGISIGIKEDTDELLESIGQAVRKKYHRIKIKIKKGKELEPLARVRENYPDIKLMVDANADYSIDDLELLKQLDDYDLMMIEQPLAYDDIYFHSIIQKELQTPICLDESIESLNDVKTAINLGSCQIINIKQGRVGGILSAITIQNFCSSNGIKVWSGGMLETGIGRAFNIHLQTLPGFTLPGDTSETSRYFQEDIVEPNITLRGDGFIDIPEGEGMGVQIIPERLEHFTTFSERIETK
ncbi:MAG: o-succinylbenzoate synthase [Candidatus Heimdallarchaeota archaeon]|nr:MAG: o-succinylbenzoate synthase [Candidatus Heimdallarchaeota archaeon]